MDFKSFIARKLREHMKRINISQENLAIKSNVSRSTIQRALKGKTEISAENINRICEGLEISVDVFFSTEESWFITDERELKHIITYRGFDSNTKSRIDGYMDCLKENIKEQF